MNYKNIEKKNNEKVDTIIKLARILKIDNNAVLVFINNYNLDVYAILNDLAYGTLDKNVFISAVMGNFDNKYQKNIIKKYNMGVINESDNHVRVIINKEDLEKIIKNSSNATIEISADSTPVSKINKKIKINLNQFKEILNYVKD